MDSRIVNDLPIPANEKERLKALHDYEILDSFKEDDFDRITKLASLICEVPISLISLLDENRQWLKSKVGMDVTETSRGISFCQYAIMDIAIFEVEDATKDERFKENPFVKSDPGIRFYAGYPLIDPMGYALGSLCVIDYQPKILAPNQKEALQLLAQEVISLIIERRQKEELKYFEKLFQLSNDLVCVAGTDGFLKKVNPAFEKVLGWSTEFLLSTSFFDLIHPEDVEIMHQEMQKLTTGQNTVNFINHFRTHGHQYKTLQWVVTAEPLTNNLFAIGRDISEQKAKEQQLAISEERLRAFFEHSQGLMCTHDLQGNFLSVNSAGASLLGYSRDEITKLSLFDIVPEERHSLLQGYLSEIKKSGSAKGQMLTRNKNGSLLIWIFNNVLEKYPGGEAYIIGNAADITERIQMEKALAMEKARLSAFVKHVPAAVAMLDKNINYIAVSNRWLKNYHLTGRDIIGHSYYETFPNMSQEIKERHQRVLNGAVEKNEEEAYQPEGTNQHLYAAWEMRPWFQPSKKVGGILIFTQDITSLIHQREELQTAKQMAEQASEAKSEFLANMSHEIRTPLNGVVGFTDLVLKTKLNETQRQYLSIVNQSANALLNIINDILDFSKIEAGKLELDVEKCDLYEIGCQAVDIITYQVQTKGLEMLLNISPDLPRFIWTDSIRLKQILINLLSNASKFTEKGEIELKIEVVSSREDQTTIRFGVRDTGIGIQPGKLEKIFEAFSQEDSSTTKRYGGTGLGLTISNRLLALMESKLQLQSTPGTGSTFYFDITVQTERGEPIEWENIELIKKVLVVDDNDNNRMLLSQILLLKQIQTTEAKNGFEALQLLALGEQYDVILMDYHMPDMNGLETIKKIREGYDASAEEQPIILLHSSSDDEKVIKTCEELEVNQRLVKPIKIQNIYNVLAHLHKKRTDAAVYSNLIKIEPIGNNITILIAEDNAFNMLLTKTIINTIAPDAVLLEAQNGKEAVAQYESFSPDLIFMDIQMPEMNGFDATKKIRSMEKKEHIPIIALTAGNVKSEKEKCFAAGMDDFVVKPFVKETIVSIFSKWLNVYH
jgi:PAS domain S-box-containing protein